VSSAADALLIVNADDWGGSPEATDAMEKCFVVGAITSATGMVFMPDSRRSSEIALLGGRAIGLHLNLTQPFEDAPAAVRDRQLQVIPHFERLHKRRWTIDPRPSVRRMLRDAIRDQLDEFRRLYGHDPTHIDGHHHVHITPDVLQVLPRDIPIRQTLSATPGARSLPRRLKHRWIASRFRTTDEFWAFYQLHPDLWGEGFGPAIERARSGSVEIMCHPSCPEELELLLTDAWLQLLAGARLGAYGDLTSA
jgi:predicted glycoside hydrolase/deacetylase ChbG (UPF0249 family)